MKLNTSTKTDIIISTAHCMATQTRIKVETQGGVIECGFVKEVSRAKFTLVCKFYQITIRHNRVLNISPMGVL